MQIDKTKKKLKYINTFSLIFLIVITLGCIYQWYFEEQGFVWLVLCALAWCFEITYSDINKMKEDIKRLEKKTKW
jgi:hypothetical protein